MDKLFALVMIFYISLSKYDHRDYSLKNEKKNITILKPFQAQDVWRASLSALRLLRLEQKIHFVTISPSDPTLQEASPANKRRAGGGKIIIIWKQITDQNYDQDDVCDYKDVDCQLILRGDYLYQIRWIFGKLPNSL